MDAAAVWSRVRLPSLSKNRWWGLIRFFLECQVRVDNYDTSILEGVEVQRMRRRYGAGRGCHLRGAGRQEINSSLLLIPLNLLIGYRC